MNQPIEVTSRGYFRVSVTNSEGKEVKEKSTNVPVNNAITTAGAHYLLIRNKLSTPLRVYVGTGTTEITRDSVGLGSRINQSNGSDISGNYYRDSIITDNGDGTVTCRRPIIASWPLGAIVGTISEVGLYSGTASNATFVAGQLIKDEFGNPTTITLLADEQLRVDYYMEFTVPNTSNKIGEGTVTDAEGQVYPYELWAQPYFSKYLISNEREWDHRYSNRGESCFVGLRQVNGTSRVTTNSLSNATMNHSFDSVTGLLTVTVSLPTYAPGDFSGNIGFIILNSTDVNADIIDTINVIDISTTYGTNVSPPIIIKFPTPLPKTNTKAFSLSCSYQIQL